MPHPPGAADERRAFALHPGRRAGAAQPEGGAGDEVQCRVLLVEVRGAHRRGHLPFVTAERPVAAQRGDAVRGHPPGVQQPGRVGGAQQAAADGAAENQQVVVAAVPGARSAAEAQRAGGGQGQPLLLPGQRQR
ncbi:hypothetical protein GCU69_14520 [Streptomyces lycii]|uniref:Uncharacterized protein n=1 Tax=Streptomyces lycii TaxID=2654337 RepID=A0ABQ7FK97_9ACTN|nr:hypothetical protein GCU69_14520 [Streptomyces lycii]